jgi:hypothetical protein
MKVGDIPEGRKAMYLHICSTDRPSAKGTNANANMTRLSRGNSIGLNVPSINQLHGARLTGPSALTMLTTVRTGSQSDEHLGDVSSLLQAPA